MHPTNGELTDKGIRPSLLVSSLGAQKDLSTQLMELAQDPIRQGRALYELAKVFYDKCDLVGALRYFEAAKTYIQLPENFYGLVKILGFQIRIHFECLDVGRASDYIRELTICLENPPEGIDTQSAEFIYYLGQLESYRQNGLKALEYLEKAHQKAMKENESELMAKCLFSLAQVYYQAKEYQRSLNYLDQLKELLFILKKGYLTGSLQLLQGRVYAEIGQTDRALEALNLANQALQRKTYWNLYGYVLLCQGQIYKNMGEYTKSLIYFEWLKSLFGQGPFKRLMANVNTELSDLRDASVDLYLDRDRRLVHERTLGTIDFKHRFVLLEILFLLAQNPGIYFDKEVLARSIWKDEYNPLIHDKLIYTSVSRLRKLIEPVGPDKRKYLLRGKDGYTFNPHVRLRFGRNQEISNERDRFVPDIFSPV